MNGILLINKPTNMTSRDVVNIVSKIYHTKKVGHTGTLDPLATGVLILCLGSYTKLVNELTCENKTYHATMKLGVETDTGDITGDIVKQEEKKMIKERIIQVFCDFPRCYEQTVPKYSAVKINGKKLYEYAREGINVELPKRIVQILDLKIISTSNNEIVFETTVSKGTYIRSLIEDLAKEMGTVATMTNLVRTRQGIYKLENCLELTEIDEQTPLKLVEELFVYPYYEINEIEYQKVLNGNKLVLGSDEKRLFLTYHKNIIAIYEKDNLEYRIIFKNN